MRLIILLLLLFRKVIDVKCQDWLTDPRMVSCLKPSTLFRKSNFEEYLGQRVTAKEESAYDIAFRNIKEQNS